MFKSRWLGTLVALPFLMTMNTLGAGDLGRPAVMGSIAGTKGTVFLDHSPVLGREAVFSGDTVSTGASSGAYINLAGTIAILVENSELGFNSSKESASMTLKKGALEIRSGKSRPAEVFLDKASVIVRSEGDFPSICRIASVDKASVIIADKGQVEVHGTGAPIFLKPGRTLRLEAGRPQAAGSLAGKVSAEIPSATIQHGGTASANSLNLSDSVYWKDLVATQGNGRVRIALEGGSFLNIGARSQMTIVKHDAQSQQTEVELKLGTLRGEVVKLTRGGKFETRTPTAVIGVVGTIYAANATPQDTEVYSVQDDVTVSNIDPNVPGTVVLHTGQFTHVPFGLPPASPTFAPSAQIQTEVQNTTIQEGAVTGSTAGAAGTAGGQAGGTGGGAAASASGVSTGITNGAALAASGVAAASGGVAISEINKAHSNIASAESHLSDAATAAGQAASSANSAQNAATQALSAAQQANNIATTIANQVNSLLNGCGCVSPSGP